MHVWELSVPYDGRARGRSKKDRFVDIFLHKILIWEEIRSFQSVLCHKDALLGSSDKFYCINENKSVQTITTVQWTLMISMKTAGFISVAWLLFQAPTNGFSFRESNRSNTRPLANDINHSIHQNNGDVDSSVGKKYSADRRSIIRGLLPTTLLFASTVTMNPKAAIAGIDVSGLRVEGTPKITSPPPPAPRSADGIIELAGIQYTPAAMILQLAEQTASMEGMMKSSASDVMAKKSRKERIEAGSEGKGPGVVARGDLTQSVGIMVKNSKIATIAPQAAVTLQGIPEYLSSKSPSTDMSFDEYLTVAKKYEQTREDLRVAFEKLPEEDQLEGRKIVRAIRKRDMERMEAMQ